MDVAEDQHLVSTLESQDCFLFNGLDSIYIYIYRNTFTPRSMVGVAAALRLRAYSNYLFHWNTPKHSTNTLPFPLYSVHVLEGLCPEHTERERKSKREIEKPPGHPANTLASSN